jgi:hypothetical protein
MIKRAGLVILLITFFKAGYSQESSSSEKHYPSVLFGAGFMKFTGDVGKLNDVSPLLDSRFGYYLKAEYRLGKHLGLMAGGIYGKLAGTNNTKTNRLNFESKTMQFDLNLVTYFDHLFTNDPELSPYFSAGVGYMTFDPYGDLKNGNDTYYYWNDGSIKNLPEIPANNLTAVSIKRDYTYETQLKDSSVNYQRSTITVPIGAGFDWQIGRFHRWDVQLGFNYNILLSDYVDNFKSGANDFYWMAHAGIKYTFAPKQKSPASTIDFKSVDNLDADEDGVNDNTDKCLGTPKGVKVNSEGCPPDSDGDGVADYIDLEPNTKKGADVTQFGETINLDELAKRELMRDSLEAQWGDFAKNTETVYVKSENSDLKKNQGSTNSNSKIPESLQPADTNKDGLISVQEISAAIDAFFEGSNTFTVEVINKLIDYFFEQ